MKKDIIATYRILLKRYGPQHWWPGDTPWEVCVGAVLTQNTAWTNVEKAIANLKIRNRGVLPPAEDLLRMPMSDLEDAIRPSGYFRLKAGRLRAATEWWAANTKDGRLHPAGRSLLNWRESLLKVKGIGPETADSILLYCFNLPTFVIDAYTKRMMARHFGIPENIGYHEIQKIFMDSLPKDHKIYNEFHALIVRLSKQDCRKKGCSPECPLA